MEVQKNHCHLKSIDSLPFADVAIMEGEPKEDRTLSGEVSPPCPNPCHSPSPSSAQCPSIQRSRLSPSFTPPSSQDSLAEDVIYAHWDHRTLSERLFTPTPLSPMHLSSDPSM